MGYAKYSVYLRVLVFYSKLGTQFSVLNDAPLEELYQKNNENHFLFELNKNSNHLKELFYISVNKSRRYYLRNFSFLFITSRILQT